MKSRIASCHCGQFQLMCEGEPNKISMCHCMDCQRRTGSIFSIAAFYDRSVVAVHRGASKTFERESASGKPVIFHFCPECGSNVMWEPKRMPLLIGLAVGAFIDPNFPQPQQSVWVKDKHAWLNLPDEMQKFETNPPPRADSG